MRKNQKVTKKTNMAELISEFPETAEVLIDYGMHCVGCIAGAFENIEEGAKVHGLADEDIDEMVEKINAVIARME